MATKVAVYTTKVPLVGFEGVRGAVKKAPLGPARKLAQAAAAAAFNRHVVVIVHGRTSSTSFDFLPINAADPLTVCGMLVNLPTRGEVRERSLREGKPLDSWVFQGEAPLSEPKCIERARVSEALDRVRPLRCC